MSDEQLEYSAKLLADNISLEKRNKEIYEGFMATTQELCEATKEIERLNNIINELEHDFESYELEYLQETYQGGLADFIETELERIQELKGSDSND